MRNTTRQFVHCYLILAHFRHSKFNTAYISHNPFNDWNTSLMGVGRIFCSGRPQRIFPKIF